MKKQLYRAMGYMVTIVMGIQALRAESASMLHAVQTEGSLSPTKLSINTHGVIAIIAAVVLLLFVFLMSIDKKTKKKGKKQKPSEPL